MAIKPDPAFRFDGTNPAAQRVAERKAARMVTAISRETRDAIRSLVVRSIREGIPHYDAARAIRSMVGLTTQQGQAALNYRAGLIDQGLTLDRVNKLTDKYAAKLLRIRAETIARTEVMASLNEGSIESWRQAQKEGLLGKRATKEWMVTPVDACIHCLPLDGVRVGLNEKFTTGLGQVNGPPLHPRCRCAVSANA